MPAHHHRPDGTHAISTRNALKTRRENVTKLALVTGGAHPMGIGFASAKDLVKIGYEVIVTGYSTEETALTPETQIGRAHVCTPVTHAQLVCRLLLEKKNTPEINSLQQPQNHL